MLSKKNPVILRIILIAIEIMDFERPFYILAIESSCDDTAAAVLDADKLLANEVAGQDIHQIWGGVVPELASRAHHQQIVPVVHAALAKAKISKEQLHAVAFTKGPGLPGSLLVGVSFAKAFAASLNIPFVGVNHMQGHILAHLIDTGNERPEFPFLCLTVSGGHTQIVRVDSPVKMEILGQTTDDAAGEAFDKTAKMLGLPYPGGPHIDRLAKTGNPHAFVFPEPKIEGCNFSFSGLKTSMLYLLQREEKARPGFTFDNQHHLAASLQFTIVKILINKLLLAAKSTGINQLALAGGVSANSELRAEFSKLRERGFKTFIPPFEFCTDNAAMIGIGGYFLLKNGIQSGLDTIAEPGLKF
jgi:N6-L-threonylcarbamoyladenine synthase